MSLFNLEDIPLPNFQYKKDGSKIKQSQRFIAHVFDILKVHFEEEL